MEVGKGTGGKVLQRSVGFMISSYWSGNKYMRTEREKVMLPPLEPINSSRISSFQDYAQWQRQRKQAYRNELQEEMQQHTLSREHLQRQKERDRLEVNAIVHTQRQRNQQDRHLKIKTEQKYMQDNWNISQLSRHSPHDRHNHQSDANPENYREHPFSRLIDQQDQRQQDTRNNFIFQNKLNDLQSEMRRAQTLRRKHFESQQRKAFEDHVEDEYRKKQKERELFENKYLKIDKNSNYNCKKEYLEYLKAQAGLNRSQHHRRQLESTHNYPPDYMQEINRPSPGNIGLSPASFDRIKQLQTIEKSLKLFNHKEQRNQSTLDYSHRKTIEDEPPRRPNYENMLTERTTPTPVEHIPTQPFEVHIPSPAPQSPRIYPIQPQLSQRLPKPLEKPVHSPKTYRQFNIINCSDQIFVK